jgi:GNAT superfamily N-acetyltransferase
VSDPVRIRPARPGDVGPIFALIAGLAEYERARHEVTGTPELLHTALFGAHPSAEAIVAELRGQTIGFALFHGTFSTWECRPGLWLEDLYIEPEHRRAGTGEALFARVAAIAVERGCTRLAWVALHWNEPALTFYEKLGAAVLDDWKLHRLSGGQLGEVAALVRAV